MISKFNQRQADFVEQLAILPTAEERLMWLTQRPDGVFHLPETERSDSDLVQGCVSKVWVNVKLAADGTLAVRCAADSVLVAGLVLAQISLVGGLQPAEVVGAEFTWLETSGLARSISPTRQNGLAAVANALRSRAQSLLAT